MNRTLLGGLAVLSSVSLLAGTTIGADAQTHHRERPLTITRHAGGPRHGIEVTDGGNRIVAWGGFSANGYGWGPPNSEAARRAARNASVRYRTAGVYGYGIDGLGGVFPDNDLRSGGYDNPNYGGAYNTYVGYNGVPTALAFGPGFASRHITDSDDDDNAEDSGPEPQDLGYLASPFFGTGDE